MNRKQRFVNLAKRQLSRSPALMHLAKALRRRLSPTFRGLASDHWDARVDQVESATPQGWLDVDLVEVEYIRPRISGDPAVPYLHHFLRTHVPQAPVDRLLSLGCGGGNLERDLIALGAARQIDASDVSAGSIELAQRLAVEQGLDDRITYAVADLNHDTLPESCYDLVVIKHALHHLENLEHVYQQIRLSLRPGGLFMFNEFVGPTRFQWTDLQLAHMNRLLADLPKALRNSLPVVKIRRPLVSDMIALDPSESVRSAELLPLLEADFEILELKSYGGTLLHILLSYLLPAMDLEKTEHIELLRSLMAEEGRLLDAGEIPSDFAYVVARPRGKSHWGSWPTR